MKRVMALMASALLAGCGSVQGPVGFGAPAAGGTVSNAQADRKPIPQSPDGMRKQALRYAEIFFRRLDPDDDGRVPYPPAYAGKTFSIVDRSYKLMDLDSNPRDYVITRGEVETFMISSRVLRAVQTFSYNLFTVFDANGDEIISRKEFVAILDRQRHGKIFIPPDFDKGDVDQNGELSFSEFEDLLFENYIDFTPPTTT